MPIIELKTNVAVADTAAFLRNFTEVRMFSDSLSELYHSTIPLSFFEQFAAKTLSKPSFAVAVSYTHNKDLAFAGTVDPALLLTVVRLSFSPIMLTSPAHAFPR